MFSCITSVASNSSLPVTLKASLASITLEMFKKHKGGIKKKSLGTVNEYAQGWYILKTDKQTNKKKQYLKKDTFCIFKI